MSEETKVPLVYQAINKVQKLLASTGISKGRSNQQQGYKFRGIDDVYNALSSIMADAGLSVLHILIALAIVGAALYLLDACERRELMTQWMLFELLD